MFLTQADFSAENFNLVESVKMWKKRNQLADILKSLNDLEISSRTSLADLVNDNYAEFVDLVSSKIKGIAPPDLPKPIQMLEISSLANSARSTLEQARSLRRNRIADDFFKQVISRSQAMRNWPPPTPREIRRLEKCSRAFPFPSELRTATDLEIAQTWKFLITELLSELKDCLGKSDVSEIFEKLRDANAEAAAAETAVEFLVSPKLNYLASETAKFDLPDFLARIVDFPEISLNFQVRFNLEMKRKVASFLELKFPGLFLPTEDLKLFARNFQAWQKFFSLAPEFTGKWKLGIFNTLKQKLKFPTFLARLKFIWDVRVDPLFPRDLEISCEILRAAIKLPQRIDEALALVEDMRAAAGYAKEEISRFCSGEVATKVDALLQISTAQCLKNVEIAENEIAQMMINQSLVHLDNVRQVPSLYRMTSKGAPTRQSAYVDAFIASGATLPDNKWRLLAFKLVISRFEFLITEITAKEEISEFPTQQLKLDVSAISEFFARPEIQSEIEEIVKPLIGRLSR